MKRSSRKKKKSFFEKRPIVSILLVIILMFAILFLNNYPSLQPIRDSWIYTIIIKAAISGIVLYFTWLRKKKPPLFERIALSLSALLPWISTFIKSGRISLLVLLIMFYVLLIILFIHFVTDKIYNTVTGVVAGFIGITVALSAKDYTYLYESKEMIFWGIAFVIGIIAAVVYTLLIIKDVLYLKNEKTSDKVISIIFAFGISFFLAAVTIGNLNYSLDVSEPVEYTSTILKKRIDTKRRKPTEYIFIANIDGEERNFYVSQSEYYRKNVSDSFSVRLYQGAFKTEYYIYFR